MGNHDFIWQIKIRNPRYFVPEKKNQQLFFLIKIRTLLSCLSPSSLLDVYYIPEHCCAASVEQSDAPKVLLIHIHLPISRMYQRAGQGWRVRGTQETVLVSGRSPRTWADGAFARHYSQGWGGIWGKKRAAFNKSLQTESSKCDECHRRKDEDVCWKWIKEDDALLAARVLWKLALWV